MFDEILKKAIGELETNTEWEKRYSNYAEILLKKETAIKSKKTVFNEFSPLYLYMNIGSAMGNGNFNLRYKGQAVADLKIGSDGIPRITTTKYCKTNTRDFGCALDLQNIEWRSNEARDFRKHFKTIPIRNKENNKGNEEHRIESMLLGEFSKTQSVEKMLCGIQPVHLFGKARFQMPTPFSASGKSFKYSNASGGGIDILCRVKIGSNINLCVVEVKDENTNKEPPIVAIKQAIVYAIFLWKLLRSESGQKWYKIFGFSRPLPKRLTLIVSTLMPHNDMIKGDFGNTEIKLNETDKLILHTIFFKESDNKITDLNVSWK